MTVLKYLAFRGFDDLKVIPAEAPVLGIEVPPTMTAAVRERCTLGIVDPQHTEGLRMSAALVCMDDRSSAIQTFFKRVVESSSDEEIWLITPRFDLDAAVAMAMLAVHADHLANKAMRRLNWERIAERVQLVDQADNFTPGTTIDWPGPQALPTVENPWLPIGGAGEIEGLAGPNWLTGWTVGKVGLPLAVVVNALRYWLERGMPESGPTVDDVDSLAAKAGVTNDFPTLLWAAKEAAQRSRVAIAEALAKANLEPQVIHDGRVVFMDLTKVRLPSNATAGVGYCFAPVSTVYLSDARAGHNRYSVACFNPRYLDFTRFVAEINALEQGGGTWGGNPATGMIGSPLDKPTSVTIEAFLTVVGRCLR